MSVVVKSSVAMAVSVEVTLRYTIDASMIVEVEIETEVTVERDVYVGAEAQNKGHVEGVMVVVPRMHEVGELPLLDNVVVCAPVEEAVLIVPAPM